eukprot:149413-Chlamydomonas_euryale.AAC.1
MLWRLSGSLGTVDDKSGWSFWSSGLATPKITMSGSLTGVSRLSSVTQSISGTFVPCWTFLLVSLARDAGVDEASRTKPLFLRG